MIVYLVLFLSSCVSNGMGTPSTQDLPTTTLQNAPEIMTFDTNMIELGDIKRGAKRSFEYVFTNTGKEDLEIEFMSSCDCTTLDYPMDIIAPGEKGTIHVIFDSTEKTKSETVDIDIDLVNKDPKTNIPIFIRINYSFVLIN